MSHRPIHPAVPALLALIVALAASVTLVALVEPPAAPELLLLPLSNTETPS
jgi:hypothetical protein